MNDKSYTRKNFPVLGMSCAACAISVESMLKNTQGIKDAGVNYANQIAWAEVEIGFDVIELKKAIQAILDSFKVLITKQRVLLDLSEVADDEGTNALMSDYIRVQEKLVWMYSSVLG